MSDEDAQSAAQRLLEREARARAILGVDTAAGTDDIRRAFRRLSLACHPDTNPDDKDAARRFRIVCCAYKLLAKGETSPELDQADLTRLSQSETERCLDNDWAYWCWWRDRFF